MFAQLLRLFELFGSVLLPSRAESREWTRREQRVDKEWHRGRGRGEERENGRERRDRGRGQKAGQKARQWAGLWVDLLVLKGHVLLGGSGWDTHSRDLRRRYTW